MQTENASQQSQTAAASGGSASLPPVSPPSPGFIMQLFVIPLIIVSLIVGIWLAIHWVVNRDMQPAELAQDIERLNHATWQQALTLANQLRDPQSDNLRRDRELCQRLATQLQRRIDEDGMSQEQVWLRIYLCRALGEFELTDGVPSLLSAARHDTPHGNLEVQRAALQSLIYLKDRLSDETVWTQPELLEVTRRAARRQPARSEEPLRETGDPAAEPLQLRYDRLHSTAAFLLGMLDHPPAVETLAELLQDRSRDVRYNAAMGLARHGDPRCQKTLIEMLDANRLEEEPLPVTPRKDLVSPEEMEQWRLAKREMIVANALRGTELYACKATPGDPSQLIEAVQQVAANTSLGPELIQQATELLPRLRRLNKPAAGVQAVEST